jgi:aryl-alcohol dehydrogenase-like predicted oxidoreductase
MEYRTLGTSSIEVSTVAFGCWAIVGGFNWGHQERRDSLAALRTAFECGVTLFDTAEAYGKGQSEELLAEALGDVRDGIVIASKVSPSHFGRDELIEACERSLRNLRTDRIDLYQLHWPNPDVPLRGTLETLEALKAQGKIREYGVSNFGPRNMAEFLDRNDWRVQSNQLAYSLLFRAIEYEIQPLCVENGLSILCYSPIMQGLLTGKFATPDDVPVDRARTRHFSCRRPEARHREEGREELTFATIRAIGAIAAGLGVSPAGLSLAWLLSRPGVSCVIVGGRNADQAARNTQAADLKIPTDALDRLSEATAPLKEAMGPNPDMWQTDARMA